MRESDGAHFLWNGEGCIRVSQIPEQEPDPMWHHDYMELPVGEVKLLNITMQSRNRGFSIESHGRYQVVARGEFRE